MTGQLVVGFKINSEVQTINVSSLSKGIYILEIDEILKKLVIN
ncbi:T9SS type A sorting domain-containing protein [Polaribacter litorisediminis]